MVFPLGDWLLLCIGLLSFVEWRSFSFNRGFRVLPFAWMAGWIFENSLAAPQTWHWHFSRLFVLLWFAWLAWKKTSERKVLPILLTGLSLLGQDLFLINEPGIFVYDQWVFALLLVFLAFLCTQSLWGMAWALTGGILLNIGFSVFFFNGIVRHYDLPDPFVWNFTITMCISLTAIKLVREYYRVQLAKSRDIIIIPIESMPQEINSLEEHESPLT